MNSDYLNKLPTAVLTSIILNETRVFFPVKVDTETFLDLHTDDIESTNLTSEKCIYVASMYTLKQPVTSKTMLSKMYYR